MCLATDPHRLTQTLELVLLKMPAQRASITRDVIEFREQAECERINEFILSHPACSHYFKQNLFNHSSFSNLGAIDLCPAVSV